MLDLSLLKIDRLVVHHVHPRGPSNAFVKPTHGEALAELPHTGLDMFNRRIAQALGHKSRGIRMDFRDVDEGSFFQHSASLMHGDEAEFLDISKHLADRLAKVQLNRDFAASKLIVMAGTVTELQRPFAAVVKADMQDALGEGKPKAGKAVYEYLQNIFLTESQRLFKIGFVQQTSAKPIFSGDLYDPQHFSVHLFDHVMTSTETKKAAHYFYGDFLGGDVSASDKRLTKEFFEKTNKCLDTLGITHSRRIDLGEALRSELKSNEKTISVLSFGEKHLNKTERASYFKYMEKAGFPGHEISKDTEYIKTRLQKRRKITFSSGVMITTPADQIDLMKVIESENGKTIVEIDGSIESRE